MITSSPPDPETAAKYRALGAWRDRTTLDDLHDWADADPDAVAIVTKYVTAGTQRTVTVGELDDAVRRCALGLLDLGVSRGDVVSFQLPNWWEFSVLYHACAQVGAVANPVGMIARKQGAEHNLRAGRSRLFFVPRRYRRHDYVSMALELRQSVPTLEEVVVVDTERQPPGTGITRSFSDFFLHHDLGDGDRSRLASLATGPDEISLLKYTSGTTGEPKGVLHTHNSLYAATCPVPDMMELDASDVVAMAAPMVHMSGLLYGVLMPITGRQKCAFIDRWDAEALARTIEAERATWTIGATPYVIDLLEFMASGPEVDISSLEIFTCSGAPVPRYLGAMTRERLGAELRGIWGMTETGGVTFAPRKDPLGKADLTDGTTPAHEELKVVDDSGQPVPAGVQGLLMARGASTFQGYYERPALTAETLGADGWVNTGDIASLDADGYVQISGRAKDLIIRGGENVPAVTIEDALYQHPDVHEVAVIGYADDRLGERAMAVVVPRDGTPTLASLTAFLDQLGVATHFWPERLEIVEEMPHTDAGKIQKYKLRERFSGGSIWRNETTR